MFEYLVEYAPTIANGFIMTVEVTLFGIFIGLAIGILLAIGDIYGGKVVSALIRVYVEFFRGSPLVVQLFVAVYAIPEIFHIRMNALVIGFLVFALNSAAYQKGYIKGAIDTVAQEQMQAGLSIGMSRAQTLYHIILPQALRVVIPAWTNEFCSLTKSTSALALIGFIDLTGAGMTIAGLRYAVLPAYLIVAAIYLIWITAFTKAADIVYERKKIPGIELSL